MFVNRDTFFLNVLIILFFTKNLFSGIFLGFKFAAWDLFLLYPFFYNIKYKPGELHRLYFILLVFFIFIFLSTVINFGKNLAFIGITLQIIRNIFVLNFCINIGQKWFDPGIKQTVKFWGMFTPIMFISLYFSPFQSYISEEAMGKYMRLEGFSGDANIFAMTILLLVLLAGTVLSASRLKYTIMLLCFVCVILSGSRSSLALALICFFIIFYSKWIVVSFSLIGIILSKFVLDNFDAIISAFNRPLKDMSRLEFWLLALEKFDQNYLFGYGPKSFLNDIGKFSHNDFITAFYEYGFFGLVSFILLWLTLAIFPSGLKTNNLFFKQSAYLLSTFFILNLFSFWLYPHLWAVFGVMLGSAFKLLPNNRSHQQI